MKRTYPIIVERAASNYSAYSPDVLGCIATGDTVEETIALMREALEFHFEGLLLGGEALPEPRTYTTMVEVQVSEPTAGIPVVTTGVDRA